MSKIMLWLGGILCGVAFYQSEMNSWQIETEFEFYFVAPVTQ